MALLPRLGQVYQPNAECTPISIDPDHTSGVNAFLSHTRTTMQIPDGVQSDHRDGGNLSAEWQRYISRTVYEPVTPVSTPTAAQGASDVQSLTPSNSQEGVQETVPTLPANASRCTISSVSNLPATSTAASISRVHRQTYVIKYRSPSIRVYLPPSPVAERWGSAKNVSHQNTHKLKRNPEPSLHDDAAPFSFCPTIEKNLPSKY